MVKAFSVTDGCKKKVTVIITTIIFHFQSVLLHLINFQIEKSTRKYIAINTGSKQEIKLFIIYSDDPNESRFQSLMKQSNERITSEL